MGSNGEREKEQINKVDRKRYGRCSLSEIKIDFLSQEINLEIIRRSCLH